MAHMSVTPDTSQSEMSPVNLSALGTSSLLNNMLISVTADTSQDPIGPCGPLEQSANSFGHSLMAAWSSSWDFGAHPVRGYDYRVYTVAIRVRVAIMMRVRVSDRVKVRLMLEDEGRARIRGLGSGTVLGCKVGVLAAVCTFVVVIVLVVLGVPIVEGILVAVAVFVW